MVLVSRHNQDLPTYTAPNGSPTNVTVKALSSTSVFIKWQPPEPLLSNGVITNYTLTVYFVNIETIQTFSVPATTFSVHIEGTLFISCSGQKSSAYIRIKSSPQGFRNIPMFQLRLLQRHLLVLALTQMKFLS